MERSLQPELLDELPGNDPLAIGLRRDLRHINAWMGNAGSTAAWLAAASRRSAPRRMSARWR